MLGLDDVTVHAGPQRLQNIFPRIGAAHDHELQIRTLATDAHQILDALHPVQAQIDHDQHHIGVLQMAGHLREGLGFQKSLYLQATAQQLHQAKAEHLVIIGDQYRAWEVALRVCPHASRVLHSDPGHSDPDL